jgi:hypothetical protein
MKCPICKGKMRKVNGRYGLFSYCLTDLCTGKRDNLGKPVNSHTSINKQAYIKRMKQIRAYGKFDEIRVN